MNQKKMEKQLAAKKQAFPRGPSGETGGSTNSYEEILAGL